MSYHRIFIHYFFWCYKKFKIIFVWLLGKTCIRTALYVPQVEEIQDNQNEQSIELQSLVHDWTEGNVKYTELVRYLQANNIDRNDERILKMIYGQIPNSFTDDDDIDSLNEDFYDKGIESTPLGDDSFKRYSFKFISEPKKSLIITNLKFVINAIKCKLATNQKMIFYFERPWLFKNEQLLLSVLLQSSLHMSSIDDLKEVEKALRRYCTPALISSQPVQEDFLKLIQWLHRNFYSIEPKYLNIFNTLMNGLKDVKKYFSVEIWEALYNLVVETHLNLWFFSIFPYIEMFNVFPPKKVEYEFLQLLEATENRLNDEPRNSLARVYMTIICNQFKAHINQETIELILNHFVDLLYRNESVQFITQQICYLASDENEKIHISMHNTLTQTTEKLMNELDNKNKFDFNWKAYTNWGKLLHNLLEGENTSWNNYQLSELMSDYSLTLLDLSNFTYSDESPEAMLWALLLLENLFISKQFSNTNKEKLFSIKLSRLIAQCPMVADITNSQGECFRFQLKWCAEWYLENKHKFSQNSEDRSLFEIKLFSDKLSARKDYNLNRNNFKNYKENERFENSTLIFSANCTLKSGVYFYEVTLITDGVMRIGWGFKKQSSSENSKMIGLDMFSRCIWNERLPNSANSIDKFPQWHSGDVIGCLIDFNDEKITFTINGDEIDDLVELDTSISYFPAVRLSKHQHCVFNFGKTPFKFAPENIQINKLETGETDEAFTDQLLFCSDNKNDKPEIISKQFKNDAIEEFNFENTSKNVSVKVQQSLESIFEVIGFNKVSNFDKIDVIASNCNEFIGKMSTTKINRICKSISPYLKLQIQTQEDVPFHRDLCIVMSSLILNGHSLNIDNKQLFTYLNRTLSATNDIGTILQALIGITELMQGKEWICEENLLALRRSRKISNLSEKLKSKYDNLNYAQWLNSPEELKNVEIQLHLYVDKFKKIMHDLNKNYWYVGSDQANELVQSQTTLHSSDKSDYLQLSRDGLFARSDRKWQSVRSAQSDITYFEVTLVTNGAMRIGWSTSHSNLNNAKIGDDMNSVGFDGYNLCIWHDSTFHQLSNVPQWKAGDVVSCRIYLKTRTFTFTLNDCPIRLPYLNISPFPYHASVSLAPGQQCFFNFGQVTFRHANINDWEVYELLKNQPKPFQFNAPITNAMITCGTNNNISDIQMSGNSVEITPVSELLPTYHISNNCQICAIDLKTKRLRFECCDHLKFCIKCAIEVLKDCQKCQKYPGTSHGQIFCLLCQIQMATKRLQFECCGHLKFCFTCASTSMKDCPKCTN